MSSKLQMQKITDTLHRLGLKRGDLVWGSGKYFAVIWFPTENHYRQTYPFLYSQRSKYLLPVSPTDFAKFANGVRTHNRFSGTYAHFVLYDYSETAEAMNIRMEYRDGHWFLSDAMATPHLRHLSRMHKNILSKNEIRTQELQEQHD